MRVEEEKNVEKNHVYILNGNLDITGKLENLAPTERIYSARFIEDRLYLVTFRNVDPLFVIDLSNTRNPQVLGELKIPGFSNYLHPYDENHIIGIGKDTEDIAGWNNQQVTIPAGLKLALFDVSDVDNVKEIAKYTIGDRGSDSLALYDHKAFLFDKEKNLLVIPASVRETKQNSLEPWSYGKPVFEGAYVFSLDAENGFELKGLVTHLNASEQEKIKSEEYYYPYLTQIQRSFYINDALYTLSQRELRVNSIDNLDNLNKIELPFEQQIYYAYAEGGIAEG